MWHINLRQKIAQVAENEGLKPIEICDRYCSSPSWVDSVAWHLNWSISFWKALNSILQKNEKPICPNALQHVHPCHTTGTCYMTSAFANSAWQCLIVPWKRRSWLSGTQPTFECWWPQGVEGKCGALLLPDASSKFDGFQVGLWSTQSLLDALKSHPDMFRNHQVSNLNHSNYIFCTVFKSKLLPVLPTVLVAEVSNNFYVRTTEERHKAVSTVINPFWDCHPRLPQVVAREMWTKCKKNGDIYLDRYEGWCVAGNCGNISLSRIVLYPLSMFSGNHFFREELDVFVCVSCLKIL